MRSVQFGLRSILFFCFFLSCLFFSFSIGIYLDIYLTIIRWDERGNNHFSCFPIPPANEQSLNSSRFVAIIFTSSVCNYQTDSWWDLLSLDICILFIVWVHIKLSLFYYTANALTWDLNPYPPLSIYHTYPVLPQAATCPITVSQNV